MIKGSYFDGRISAGTPAEMQIGADGVVRIISPTQRRDAPLAEVSISDRVGNITRRLTFADGASFETGDNDAVDAALEHLGQHTFMHKVAHLERRWVFALGALVAVVLCSWLFIQFGVPGLARIAAEKLPTNIDTAIGAQGLEILDKTLFKPSQLPRERQNILRTTFENMSRSMDDGHTYRLEFRQGGSVGANAFALPSGIVVITDELIELADDDEQILAVLAHEIGHVRHRHALRMLLQNAGVGALGLALLGDISSASALVAAIPTALVHARHSREFETEADDFAYAWMDSRGIPRRHFAAILKKLEEKYGPKPGEKASADDSLSWLSTHPPAAERFSYKKRN